VTPKAVPGDREDAAIRAASTTRRQCICREDGDSDGCECDVPVLREQVGRLTAYAVQHPERAFIYSEIAGEWMTALIAFLPSGADEEDRVAAWMADSYGLPADADLRHAVDLGELLDMLGAPSAAAMS
jgi:hypothetical protein